jgi:phage-related protein
LIIDTGVKLLSSLVDNIDDILVPIIRMLPKLISGIVSALLSPKNIKAIIDAGISLISTLLNDIPAITRSLLGSVGEVIRELVRGFTSGDFIRQMIGVGRDLISGIAEGIKNFDLFGSVKNSFDNLVGGVKDFFGIKSPSRKFRDEIGKQLAAGIGVGFDVEMPSVTRLAVNDLDKMTSSLDTEMSTISIQHQGMSGAFAPQVTVNINGADHIDARTLAQEAAEAVSRALQNMTERRAAVYG